MRWIAAAAAGAAVAVVACRTVRETARPPTPREAYVRSLGEAGLADTEAGRAWLEAGRQALATPVAAEPSFSEVLYFDPSEPAAAGFAFDLRRGGRLELRVEAPPETGRMFLDLFVLRDGAPEHVASAGDAPALTLRVATDDTYLLRLQPELLTGGRATLTATLEPSLGFPVEGAGRSDIGSFFGDARDRGARQHHGVDIFAPRGTTALAAADGRVARVGTNRLGGNVVWLQSDVGLSLYYAHLDRQLVRSGERVQAGDPVGEVGSTGNAEGTSPHLHFGVYAGGPVDPMPFIAPAAAAVVPVRADLGRLGAWSRTSAEGVRVRAAPDTRAAIRLELPRGGVFRTAGVRGDWYRARLPDGTVGYVAGWLTESAQDALERRVVDRAGVLRHRPSPEAAEVMAVSPGEALDLLGRWSDGLLVRRGGRVGWLLASR